MPRRRGRKRSAVAREASGRPQREKPVDLSKPTPELQARRDALLGKRAGDARLSPDYPLDVLLARGLLTPDQHRAGWAYAALSWWAAGKPFADVAALASAIRGAPGALSGPLDEKAAIRRYRRAVNLRETLLDVGIPEFFAVDRAAVRLQAPGADELPALRRGLDAIDAALRGRRFAPIGCRMARSAGSSNPPTCAQSAPV